MAIKDFFLNEAEKTIKSVQAVRKNGDFSFYLLADSHLSDNEENTLENIKYVDDKLNFNCLVHLGDFLCGNIPERATRKLLNECLAGYRDAINSGEIYVAQGNHDGYRDETYKGQTVTDMAIDEKWYEDTKFMDENKNLVRPDNKPYYFVDFPEYKIRFVVLCTNSYIHNKEMKIFKKIYGMHDEQIEWLGETLLSTPKDYVTFICSHINPFERNKINPNIKTDREKYIAKTWPNYENMTAMIKAFNEGESFIFNGKNYDFSDKKGTVAAWLFGHMHCDVYLKWEGINCVSLPSQSAYITQLVAPLGESYPECRDMNTVFEDAWDCVVLKKDERKIYFTRFGTGDDRVIEY